MLRSLLLLTLLPVSVFSQTTQDQVRDYRRAHEQQIIKEFTTLLAIPNVAADTSNIRKNAAMIVELMKQRGLNPRLLEAKNSERSTGSLWRVEVTRSPAHDHRLRALRRPTDRSQTMDRNATMAARLSFRCH
jgi:hypothetical protein